MKSHALVRKRTRLHVSTIDEKQTSTSTSTSALTDGHFVKVYDILSKYFITVSGRCTSITMGSTKFILPSRVSTYDLFAENERCKQIMGSFLENIRVISNFIRRFHLLREHDKLWNNRQDPYVNDSDFCGNAIKEIPEQYFYQYISVKDGTRIAYAFDIRELYKYNNGKETYLNPYTNEFICSHRIMRMVNRLNLRGQSLEITDMEQTSSTRLTCKRADFYVAMELNGIYVNTRLFENITVKKMYDTIYEMYNDEPVIMDIMNRSIIKKFKRIRYSFLKYRRTLTKDDEINFFTKAFEFMTKLLDHYDSDTNASCRALLIHEYFDDYMDGNYSEEVYSDDSSDEDDSDTGQERPASDVDASVDVEVLNSVILTLIPSRRRQRR